MADADFLKFDKEALIQSSRTLAEARAAIAGQLAALNSTSSTLSAQWTGEANEAFTTAHAKWDTEFERMSTILETISTGLDKAAQGYDRAEKANGSRWPG